MREISTIQGAVWAIQEVEKYTHLQPGSAFNYAFYDPITGEVWATRIVVGAERTVWKYSARRKSSMDITIPIEWSEDRVHPGLLAAILVGDWSPDV